MSCNLTDEQIRAERAVWHRRFKEWEATMAKIPPPPPPIDRRHRWKEANSAVESEA